MFLVSDLPTGRAGTKRDGLSVVVCTVRGGEVSSRAIALVERVEVLVAVAFGFALDAIVEIRYCTVWSKETLLGTRESRASHVIAIWDAFTCASSFIAARIVRDTGAKIHQTVTTQCHPLLAAASPSP